jgi:hypothetical protein
MENLMGKIPPAVEEFLKCKLNACNEIDPYFHSPNKVNYAGELVKAALDEIALNYKRYGYRSHAGLYTLLLEPLKNAAPQNNSQLSSVGFSLILSQVALVARYFDSYDYFKKEELKKKLEARTIPADFIHQDPHRGELYLGVSVKNPKFFSEIR